jgi:hypothetical protein
MTQCFKGMTRHARRLGAVAAIGAALAFSTIVNAASTVRYGQGYTGVETANFLIAAGARGPVLMSMQNNPFGAAWAEGAAAASATQALSQPIRFTPNAAEAADPSWRYVLVFDPPDGANIRDACAGPVAAQPRPTSLDVLASFCQGNRAFAGARGTTVRTVSTEDPHFGQLVAEVTRTVFSVSDVDDHGDGGQGARPSQTAPSRQLQPVPVTPGRNSHRRASFTN